MLSSGTPLWMVEIHSGSSEGVRETGEETGANGDCGRALDAAGGAPLAALELMRTGTLEHRTEVLRGVVELAVGRSDVATAAGRWLEMGLPLCTGRLPVRTWR